MWKDPEGQARDAMTEQDSTEQDSMTDPAQ
jgi:hypothetical protein